MKKKLNKKNKNKNKLSSMQSSFDTQGSWTGTCVYDKNEKPVQDVDDL